MNRYTVTAETARGLVEVDLASQSEKGAAGRAKMSLLAAGYGDWDEVKILQVDYVGAL